MDRNIVLVIAAAIVVGIIVLAFKRPRQPKNPFFSCGRCRKTTRHDQRTIRAWRLGKDRFFCGPCHRSWLATQPPPPRPVRAPPHVYERDAGSRGGCLGIAVVLIGAPAVAALAYLFH